MSIAIEKIDAIHVYMKGDVSQDGKHPHVDAMDCWCEPVIQIMVEQAPRGHRALPIVVHGTFIQVCAALVEKKANWTDMNEGGAT